MSKRERKITDKQQLFCKEYIMDFNGAKAYLRAGYNVKESTARVNASKLLTKANINEFINDLKKSREEKLDINAEWVLKQAIELLEIAKGTKPHVASVLAKSGFIDIRKMPKDVQIVVQKEVEKLDDSIFTTMWAEHTLADGAEIRIRLKDDKVVVQYYKIGKWIKQEVCKTNIKEANNILGTIGKHTTVKAFDNSVDLGEGKAFTIVLPAGFEE